ncbi:hypothetical protein ACN5PQ_004231 [Cronobacter turicensis]
MELTESFGLIITLGVTIFIIYLVFHTGAVHDDFKKNGIKTEAAVTNIRQIGSSGAGSPKCIFSLRFLQKITLRLTLSILSLYQFWILLFLKESERSIFIIKKASPKRYG